jgi:hypothetical protein
VLVYCKHTILSSVNLWCNKRSRSDNFGCEM